MFESNGTEAVYDSGGSSGDAIRSEDSPQIVARYARSEDIVEFFGEPNTGTIRAIVAELDGRVVGVVGIVREGQLGKYFSNFSEELRPHLKSIVIMRAVKKSMEFVRDYKGPVLSVAESAEGCHILTRLGFEHLQGAVYGWVK